MQFLRALGILGLLVALSIALKLYLGGSIFIWIVGAWIFSAPMILLDAWLFSARTDQADKPDELGSVGTVQPAVQKLARSRADE